MSFVAGPVRVAVPATSANLGPGFDSLGLALDLHDELTASVTDEGLVVEVEGEGAGTLALDESHLVVRSMWAGFAAMGVAPPGIRLQCRNAIPHARGLGSSSAAIVGGLGLARALVADGAALLPDADLVSLAADLEGHPDNVAPGRARRLHDLRPRGRPLVRRRGARRPRVRAVVFVPPFALSTELARGLLPESVPHADAAADAGRTALLVAALGGAPEHLLAATRDYLHQSYRRAGDARLARARRRAAGRRGAGGRLGRGPDGARVRRGRRTGAARLPSRSWRAVPKAGWPTRSASTGTAYAWCPERR